MRVEANLHYWSQKIKSTAPTEQEELRLEHHNLLRALEFGLAIPATLISSLHLALGVFPLLDGESTAPNWYQIYQRAINNAHHPHLKAQLLNQLGYLYSQARKGQASLEVHKKAEAIGEEHGSPEMIAQAHVGISQSHWVLDQTELSVKYAKLALEELGSLESQGQPLQDFALAHNALGLALHSRGDYNEAQKHFRKAITIIKHCKVSVLKARLHNNYAFSLQEEGLSEYDKSPADNTRKMERAEGQFSKALSIYKELGRLKQMARVELSRCSLHIRLGNYTKAEKKLQRISTDAKCWGADYDLQAQTAYAHGQMALLQAHWMEAEIYLQNALQLWEQAGDELMQAQMCIHLSHIYFQQGKQDALRSAMKKAQDLLEKMPSRPLRDKLLLEIQIKQQTLAS
ncbi:MAG: tetratricopeptide repeat protein [Chloroflexi bacterium]|nr:tetratricopeptide repeat protein [Chloroflexota bacterium]